VNIIFGLCITFPILAIIAVAARFYSRNLAKVASGADDWLILVALLCCISNGITGMIGVFQGDLGKKQPLGPNGFALPSPKLTVFKKVNYASTPFFILAITCAKLSVLLFYRRVFSSVKKFIIPFWIMFGLNFIYGFSFFWIYILQCIPISQVWRTLVGEKRTCVNTIINYPFAYADVILDFLVLAIPIPMVLQLRMKTRRKIAVIAIFMLGSLVLATSIAKAVAFSRILGVVKKDHDTTYDEAPIFYWTIPESCIAVVAACLPTIRPVFRGWSAESIVASIRSIISLRSLDSQGNRSTRSAGYIRSNDTNSESATRFNDSTKPEDREDWGGMPATTISHVNVLMEHLSDREGDIRVQKAFVTTEEHV